MSENEAKVTLEESKLIGKSTEGVKDPEDRGEGYSGIGRKATPVRPRHDIPGGTRDEDEPVELRPRDVSRARGLNENAMPGSVSGHDPSSFGHEGGGEVSRMDSPFAIPADNMGTDKPEFLPRKDMEWGRENMFRGGCCRWEEFAENPGYKIELPSAQVPMDHNPGFDQTMHEWGQGKLHSGSKQGPMVKSQKQALAIAFKEKGE